MRQDKTIQTRQGFENAVQAFSGYVKRFTKIMCIFAIIGVAWLAIVIILKAATLPPVQFTLLVVACPALLCVAAVYSGYWLDSKAKELNLRCTQCKRWFMSQMMIIQIRQTGKCPNCHTEVFSTEK